MGKHTPALEFAKSAINNIEMAIRNTKHDLWSQVYHEDGYGIFEDCLLLVSDWVVGCIVKLVFLGLFILIILLLVKMKTPDQPFRINRSPKQPAHIKNSPLVFRL